MKSRENLFCDDVSSQEKLIADEIKGRLDLNSAYSYSVQKMLSRCLLSKKPRIKIPKNYNLVCSFVRV
jgi:hypothetical protein